MSYYTDKNRFNFVGKSFAVVPTGSDTVDTYTILEDPSTVGFYVEFFIGEAASMRNRNTIAFKPKRGLLANYIGAAEYLEITGESSRAIALERFKDLLDSMQKHPWTFTSVGGLSKLYIKQEAGATRLGEKGVDITLSGYENIEHRGKALADLYREIVWDYKNQRYALPENMRKFDMRITVFEYKNIDATANFIKNELQRKITGFELKDKGDNDSNKNKQSGNTLKDKIKDFASNAKSGIEKAQQKIGGFVEKGTVGMNKAEEWLGQNDFFKGTKTSAMLTDKLEAAKSGLMKLGLLAGATGPDDDGRKRYSISSVLPIHVYDLYDCEFKFLIEGDKWIDSIDGKDGSDVEEFSMTINVGDVNIQNSYPTLFGTVGRTELSSSSTDVYSSAESRPSDIKSVLIQSEADFESEEKYFAEKKSSLKKIDNTILGELKKLGIKIGQSVMDSMLETSYIGSAIDTSYLQTAESDFEAKRKMLNDLESIVKDLSPYDYDESVGDYLKLNGRKKAMFDAAGNIIQRATLYDFEIKKRLAILLNKKIENIDLKEIETLKELVDVEFNTQVSEMIPLDVELKEPATIKDINGIELKENKPNLSIDPIELKELEIAANLTDVELNDIYDAPDITDVTLGPKYTPPEISGIEFDDSYDEPSMSDVTLGPDYTPPTISDVTLKNDYQGPTITDVELKNDYQGPTITDVELKNDYQGPALTDVELKNDYQGPALTDVELKNDYQGPSITDVTLKDDYEGPAITDVEMDDSYEYPMPSDSVEMSETYEAPEITDVEIKENYTAPDITDVTLKNDYEGPAITDVTLKNEYEGPAITDVELKETYTPTEIMDVELKETYDPTEIMDVELKETYNPSEIVNVDLKETYDKKEIMGIDLAENESNSSISPVDLKEASSNASISGIELKQTEIKSEIMPIEMNENKTKSEIMDIDLKENKQQKEIVGIELKEEYKEVKPEQNVVLKTEYNKGKITDVSLVENKPKKSIGTVKLIAPKVKNEMSDIDLAEDLTQYEAPKDVDLDEPDYKTTIEPVKDAVRIQKNGKNTKEPI